MILVESQRPKLRDTSAFDSESLSFGCNLGGLELPNSWEILNQIPTYLRTLTHMQAGQGIRALWDQPEISLNKEGEARHVVVESGYKWVNVNDFICSDLFAAEVNKVPKCWVKLEPLDGSDCPDGIKSIVLGSVQENFYTVDFEHSHSPQNNQLIKSHFEIMNDRIVAFSQEAVSGAFFKGDGRNQVVKFALEWEEGDQGQVGFDIKIGYVAEEGDVDPVNRSFSWMDALHMIEKAVKFEKAIKSI